MTKKAIIILAVIALLVAGWFSLRLFQRGRLDSALSGLQSEIVQRESLQLFVSADGVVRSEQAAVLMWKARGIVEQ